MLYSTLVRGVTMGSPTNSLGTPILFTISCGQRSWKGPIQTLYHQNRYLSLQAASFLRSNMTSSSSSPYQSPLIPLYINQSGRRSYQSWTTTQQMDFANHLQRIHKNVARIYARRILTIAMASAALQRSKCQIAAQLEGNPSRPVDWENWSRREWSRELLESLGNNTFSRLWAATQRIVSLSCLILPFSVLYPLSYLSETVEQWSWKYALWSIEQAGPTYIKLFQWATTRQDLFSAEFCHYFSKLQDQTAGHSWDATLQILHQDLVLPASSSSTVSEPSAIASRSTSKRPNPNFHVVNDYIALDPKPIGSGCVAQVYRGTLTRPMGSYDAGTEIAVKVQHPGIWHKVCVDFYIMHIGARFLEALPLLNLQFLSLVDSVRKFRDIMLPQLDLTIEARHLDRFNRDFEADPNVSFPVPLHDLTNTRVLAETFIHGAPILHYVHASEAERKELALLGLNTTLKMIFLNDFLHGDLHPGNILVSRDKSVAGQPLRLHLLDCGLVVEMGPEQHVNLVKILGAFARRNGRLAGQLMVDTSSDCQASDIDIELFVKGIEHIVVDDENNNFLEKVGDYITDICFLACQRKVKLESSFINAALAVEIMEGIATALYPDLKVTTVAMPLVVQAELMHRLPKFSLW